MPVTVRLFAGLRERAGSPRRELEGVDRVADVWPALDLGEQPAASCTRSTASTPSRDRSWPTATRWR